MSFSWARPHVPSLASVSGLGVSNAQFWSELWPPRVGLTAGALTLHLGEQAGCVPSPNRALPHEGKWRAGGPRFTLHGGPQP